MTPKEIVDQRWDRKEAMEQKLSIAFSLAAIAISIAAILIKVM